MNNRLKFSYLLNPIPLKMFDGSTPSNVSKKVQMPITFSTGEMHHLEFFITNLDKNYSLVLGYDWLAQHNPNIDWMETKIMFREPKNLKKEPASSGKIDICMVSAVTMTKLCKDPGTSTFVISTTNLNLSQATATEILDSIPAKYHEFCDIFSGEKVGTLAPHRPYDLQINVEEGAKPIHRPIYSLSPLELAALREFLKEHTRNGFICPSKSPWGSPILFVKKKDSSLCLCVDFCTLNRVTEKDCTPPHFGPTHVPRTCQNILQNRPQACLPSGPHRRRRRAQDHISHTLQLIRMVSNAIRTLQCTGGLPEVHQ